MGVPGFLRDSVQPARLVEVDDEPRRFNTDRLNVQAIGAVLQRRFKLYLAVSSGVFLAAAVITLLQKPEFTAVSRVMLTPHQSEIAPQERPQPGQGGGSDEAIVDSEIALLKSRALAGQVVDALHLEQDPAFAPETPDKAEAAGPLAALKSALGKLKSSVRSEPPQAPLSPAQAAAERREDIIDQVIDGLAVEQVSSSYALDLVYKADDRVTASKLANGYAEAYARYKLTEKIGDNQQANDLLSGRIEDLRRQAQEDARALQQFRIDNNLMSTSGASLTEQEISSYNQAVTAARAQYAEDEARLNTARAQLRSGSIGDDVGEALNSVVIQNLRTQRATTSGQVADLMGRYGPMHPDLLKAQRELADIDRQIGQEITRIISNLEAKARVSRERLESLQASLGGARADLRQNNQAMVKLGELEKKAEASQTLYQSYLERVKETAAQDGVQRTEVRVVSLARPPAQPSAPHIFLNMGLGVILGISAGVLAAYLAEMSNASLATAEDVEGRLGLNYLGSVPLLSSVDNAGRGVTTSIVDHPRSAYAEAFRNLRTSISYAVGDAPRVVVVTSALPQEGKTTTSVGLAQSAAMEGQRVLLIDCDIRRRSLNKALDLKPTDTGLLELLAGETNFQEAVMFDPLRKIYVLGVNLSPRQNSELLTGPEMELLLKNARRHFQLIVLDAPPVLPVADTRELVSKADAVLFVARWQKTPEQAIHAAFRMLPRGRSSVSGVALTQVDLRKQAKYGFGDPGYYYNQYKSYYS